VNPVIPEAVNQIAFQVVGHDVSVTMASESGQLQLNVFEPVMAYALLTSVRLLTRGYRMLRKSCVAGITANEEVCMKMVTNSIGIVTALLPFIGYANASQAAKVALAENKGVAEVVVELGYLNSEQVRTIRVLRYLDGCNLN
jgi:aspartate ammonia-lyase